MYTLLASLGIGVLVAVGFGAVFGGGSVKIVYGILPGVIAAGVAYFFIVRRFMRDVQALMGQVQEVLKPKNPMRPQKPRIGDAVAILEKGYRYKRWVPFLEQNVNSQIGQLYFLEKKWDEAEQYLQNGFARNWVGVSMLAVIHFKKKNHDGMVEAFERCVKTNKTESLAWNAYAWCLLKRGDRDAAIAVLNRAVEHVKSDERTKKNLDRVQNGKGMDMKGWREMWYQFHLEKPPQQMLGGGRAGKMSKRDKRALYRGR